MAELAELRSLRVVELRQQLRAQGLSTHGRKADLLQRLLEARDVEQQQEKEDEDEDVHATQQQKVACNPEVDPSPGSSRSERTAVEQQRLSAAYAASELALESIRSPSWAPFEGIPRPSAEVATARPQSPLVRMEPEIVEFHSDSHSLQRSRARSRSPSRPCAS